MANSNSRQAMWVGIGSFFSFLVGIISPIILSRVFTKGDYGTYKQVMFVYNSLIMVFTLGLPKAYSYFLPKYDKSFSKDIINKITHLFILMGLVFSLFLFTCSGIIAKALNNNDLSFALKIFSPTPFFLLQTFGLEGIYASFQKTAYFTIYTISTRIFTVIITVLPVFLFHGNYIHAIIGFDLASLVTFILALFMKSLPVREETHKPSNLSYRKILSFSLPLLYAAVWGLAINSTTQFFISRYYGNTAFADFSNGFMEIPFASMVVSAIAAVLLPRLSELENGDSTQKEDIVALWRSALIKSAKIIFPILVFSIVFARLIMVCLYGNTYATSSIYFQIKNTSSLFYIVPFAPIMLAIGKTKTFANIHMVTAFLIVILEFICIQVTASPIVLAVVSELCNVLKLYLMMHVVSEYVKKSTHELIPFRTLGVILTACTLASLPVYVLSLLLSINKFILLFLLVITFCLCYYWTCFIFKISYREVVMGLIPKQHKGLLKFIP